VSLAHISDPVVCDLPGLPGRSDLIILYYCLMAKWTGLGDNTELFWAVLSQVPGRDVLVQTRTVHFEIKHYYI
jgi:hypothetical protein